MRIAKVVAPPDGLYPLRSAVLKVISIHHCDSYSGARTQNVAKMSSYFFSTVFDRLLTVGWLLIGKISSDFN